MGRAQSPCETDHGKFSHTSLFVHCNRGVAMLDDHDGLSVLAAAAAAPLDDHDGLSVLDVDALVSVSVSPDQAYAEIWDQLAAARRAIVAATSPCASAPSVPPDPTCAPVIFSKVPLCAQPHAGIHDDPLFACLDFMGDGQPRRFVVYHDKEGWKELQSQIGGACLQSVDVDNSASDFTFSANTARTARSAPVGLRWRRCCVTRGRLSPISLANQPHATRWPRRGRVSASPTPPTGTSRASGRKE